MATIKDVAARAGVTPTTVTNVLRGKGRTSEATRERVLAAVAAEGYRPNLNARALVEQKAPTLALMLRCITNPFYPEFTLQAHLATRRHDRFLLICNADYESDGGKRFLDEVAGSLSDGVLVANKGDIDFANLKEIVKRGVPVVVSVWEDPLRHPGIPCVAFDSRHAGRVATEHLLSLGHKKIGAILTSGPEGIHGGRLEGYTTALSEACLSPDPGMMHFCQDTIEAGYAAGKTLLPARPDITAMFVTNDLPAIGLLRAAAELGIRVPRDLSVVGITNIQLAAQSSPALTTVAIPTAEMASRGIELLLELLADKAKEPPMECISGVELVVRQSTGPVSKRRQIKK